MTDLRRTDEDAFLIPDSWWAKAEPWRGRGPAQSVQPAAKARTKYRKLVAGEHIPLSLDLTAECGDTELAELGRAALTNPESAAPLGAAVLGILAEAFEHPDQSTLADIWVAQYGVVTATEIAILHMNLELHGPPSEDRSFRGYALDGSCRSSRLPAVRRATSESIGWPAHSEPVLRRLRAHLAAASDDAYRAAVELLGDYRGRVGGLPVRLASSYLVPTERDWCDADLALEEVAAARPWLGMVASAASVEQFTHVGGSGSHHLLATDRYLYSALVQLGSGSLPLLITRFDAAWQAAVEREIAAVLALMPTDEAFGFLLERHERMTVHSALAEAAQRFPRRALRMLIADHSGSARVRQLIRRQTLIYPDIAAELGIAVEPVTAEVPPTGTATMADLPEPLRDTAELPNLPAWLIPSTLPPIVLRHSHLALPDDAVLNLCRRLISAAKADDRTGSTEWKAAIDPRSLAEFGWALLETWRLVGYPYADNWVLHAQGILGDDDTARKLTAQIRAWPGESAHSRAVSGLDALAAIGTDVALMLLNGIAEKVKFNGIKTAARAKIAVLAERLGLSSEELADRLVPDFGLASDGTLRLDYGPRTFLIGFDEQLRPLVRDADGTPLKSLPKPGVRDDAELAPAAYKTFTALKKDVKNIASGQIHRLERAMIQSRRWNPTLHRQLFVEHPLIRNLSNRLVWGVFDEQHRLIGSFRIAEDGSYADIDDNEVKFADDALIGIAHPLHLAESTAAWGEVFADYEVLQPFPQLDREVHLLSDGAKLAEFFARFEGCTVPAATVMGMTARGWQRQTPQDNGESWCVFRQLTTEHSAVVDISPGLSIGVPPAEQTDQQLERPRVVTRGNEAEFHRTQETLSFDVLDAVSASEVLRDLEFLAAAAQ